MGSSRRIDPTCSEAASASADYLTLQLTELTALCGELLGSAGLALPAGVADLPGEILDLGPEGIAAARRLAGFRVPLDQLGDRVGRHAAPAEGRRHSFWVFANEPDVDHSSAKGSLGARGTP